VMGHGSFLVVEKNGFIRVETTDDFSRFLRTVSRTNAQNLMSNVS
jgi:hypothetical protein